MFLDLPSKGLGYCDYVFLQLVCCALQLHDLVIQPKAVRRGYCGSIPIRSVRCTQSIQALILPPKPHGLSQLHVLYAFMPRLSHQSCETGVLLFHSRSVFLPTQVLRHGLMRLRFLASCRTL